MKNFLVIVAMALFAGCTGMSSGGTSGSSGTSGAGSSDSSEMQKDDLYRGGTN